MDDYSPLILVVDDEKSILKSLSRILIRENYQVITCEDPREAVEVLRNEYVSLLLSDLKMKNIDGLSLLKMSRKISPESEIIIMTAYGSVEVAVEAIKEGAYDFITKPIKKAQLLKTIDKALEKQKLVRENRSLRKELALRKKQNILVGNSPVFKKTMDLISQVSDSKANVLIYGESGTGKELAAKTIHNLSPRSGEPFVAVNCAALPESIIESELFGYVKGAFTGASSGRQGRFIQADGGTLLLDEIGELASHLQVKLLRVLQEGVIEQVGADKAVQADIRLIAATHKDLRKEVEKGKFREDLFYRLNVINVTMPPLRNRLDDIPLLVTHFIDKFNKKNNKEIKGIDESALEILSSYHWPGNVRELENIIERAVVLTREDIIRIKDLPPELTSVPYQGTSISVQIGTPLEDIENKIIKETLRFTDGNKKDAAKLLGIATRTIYRRVSED
ncbi:MAG: sigma-54 dependent transcriptional regulator [Deltaproteobacteria bacterium]|jgi:two-component system response regulator HydG|nr:sigma-54 dependent transcriptional regulator [Deltaproteobacteria bacterium]